MRVLAIPALAIVALLALRRRKEAWLREPGALPVTTPRASMPGDGLVAAWRRAGVL